MSTYKPSDFGPYDPVAAKEQADREQTEYMYRSIDRTSRAMERFGLNPGVLVDYHSAAELSFDVFKLAEVIEILGMDEDTKKTLGLDNNQITPIHQNGLMLFLDSKSRNVEDLGRAWVFVEDLVAERLLEEGFYKTSEEGKNYGTELLLGFESPTPYDEAILGTTHQLLVSIKLALQSRYKDTVEDPEDVMQLLMAYGQEEEAFTEQAYGGEEINVDQQFRAFLEKQKMRDNADQN